jgi:hypothetical protein
MFTVLAEMVLLDTQGVDQFFFSGRMRPSGRKHK